MGSSSRGVIIAEDAAVGVAASADSTVRKRMMSAWRVVGQFLPPADIAALAAGRKKLTCFACFSPWLCLLTCLLPPRKQVL